MIKDTRKLVDDVRHNPELHDTIRVTVRQVASNPSTHLVAQLANPALPRYHLLRQGSITISQGQQDITQGVRHRLIQWFERGHMGISWFQIELEPPPLCHEVGLYQVPNRLQVIGDLDFMLQSPRFDGLQFLASKHRNVFEYFGMDFFLWHPNTDDKLAPIP